MRPAAQSGRNSETPKCQQALRQAQCLPWTPMAAPASVCFAHDGWFANNSCMICRRVLARRCWQVAERIALRAFCLVSAGAAAFIARTQLLASDAICGLGGHPDGSAVRCQSRCATPSPAWPAQVRRPIAQTVSDCGLYSRGAAPPHARPTRRACPSESAAQVPCSHCLYVPAWFEPAITCR